MATSALAQKEACISLLAGAGYAAEMQVCKGTPGGSNNLCGDWSSKFTIGNTQCQSLAQVPVGQQFFVNEYAWWGNTVTCTPAPVTRTDSDFNIVYQSWGTTLNHKCVQPGAAESTEQEKAGEVVSLEGKKAKDRVLSNKTEPAAEAEKEKQEKAKKF